MINGAAVQSILNPAWILLAVGLVVQLAPAQDLSAREVIDAAIEAEVAIVHGEIVFEYELDPPLQYPGLEDPAEGALIFTFRNARQFRIIVQGPNGVVRSIVSDGAFIDTGNGEQWDIRFFSEPMTSGIQSDNERIYELLWPYFSIILPHMYPLRQDGLEQRLALMARAGFKNVLSFDSQEGGASGPLVIIHTFPRIPRSEWNTKYEIIPDRGFRVRRLETVIEGVLWHERAWSRIEQISQERFVPQDYQYNSQASVPATAYKSSIEFSSSNFDHMPVQSEFVIDESAITKTIHWTPPHPIAFEIEYYADDWFGLDIDADPIFGNGILLFVVAASVPILAAMGIVGVILLRRTRE